MGKPILLYDNRYVDGTVTATDTASGFDVNNIKDYRTFTFWKGASAGQKYISVNCGSPKAADSLAIIGHNFRTAEADLSLQYSNDGVAFQTALTIAKTGFSRSSAAYGPDDGSQVVSGAPRYVTGSDGKANGAIFIEEGTTNYLQNSSFTNYVNGYNPGWDQALNADLRPNGGWTSGYNSGVTSPQIGYHAHLIANGGVNNGSCFIFQDLNSAYGLPHRWLGVNQSITFASLGGLSIGDKISVSYMAKVDTTGKKSTLGLYHLQISPASWAFEDCYADMSLSAADTWVRITKTFTVGTNWDLVNTTYFYLYLYGQYGTEGTLWVDMVQLEKRSYATSWQDDAGGARALETLTHPLAGIVNPLEGTVAFRLQFDTPYSGIISQATSPVMLQIGSYYQNASITLWAFYSNAAGAEPALKLYVKGATNSAWSLDKVVKASGTGWYDQGVFHHFVLTWSSGHNFRVYRDGVLLGGPYTIADPVGAFAGSLAYIGSHPSNIGGTKRIDEYQVFNRALSDYEVAALCAGESMSECGYSRTGRWSFDGTLLSGLIPNDNAFLRIFPETAAQYWRISLNTASMPARLAVVALGERLTFERYLEGPYDPTPEKIEGDSQRSKTGNLLGSVVYYHSRKINADFKNLTPAWVRDRFKPAWDSHLSQLKPFFFGWDQDNHPDEVFFVKLPENFELRMPYDGPRRSLHLEFEGVKE